MFEGDLMYAKKLEEACKGLIVPLLNALRRRKQQLQPPFPLVEVLETYHRVDSLWEVLHVGHSCLHQRNV